MFRARLSKILTLNRKEKENRTACMCFFVAGFNNNYSNDWNERKESCPNQTTTQFIVHKKRQCLLIKQQKMQRNHANGERRAGNEARLGRRTETTSRTANEYCSAMRAESETIDVFCNSLRCNEFAVRKSRSLSRRANNWCVFERKRAGSAERSDGNDKMI